MFDDDFRMAGVLAIAATAADAALPLSEVLRDPHERILERVDRIERKLLVRIDLLEQELAASQAREAKLAKKLASRKTTGKGTKES